MVRHIGSATQPTQTGRTAAGRTAGGADFHKALLEAHRRGGDVRLSAHAQQRIKERNLFLSPGDMERVSKAADRLAGKGGREALVVMDSMGLILDVRNRTVVTAIERQGLRENVFTNIDSAVFA